MTVGAAYGRLWHRWMRPHWKLLLLSLVLMVIIAVASAGYAKFMQHVMSAFESSQRNVVYWGPLGVILLTSIKGVSQYLQQLLMNRVLSRIQADMQRKMFRALVRMDLGFLLAEPPAALAARFSADIELIRAATREVFGLLTAVLTIITTVSVMLSIDWAMTIGLIMIFTLALGPVGIVGSRVRRISSATQKEIAQMTSAVNEGLSGIRMVRTYQLEDRLEASANAVFERLYSLRLSIVKWQASITPLMEILGGMAIGALLFLVALRMQSGAIDLAGFIGLLTALAVATAPARRLGGGYAVALQGMAALERVYALFDSKNTITEGSKGFGKTRAKGELTFKQVSFTYPDGFKALSEISLKINAGQTFAFVGRSGAGKSTVFNLIPRLYDASAGAITLDGKDIRTLRLSELRNQISVVSQDSVLLSGTVLDNIKFGKDGASRKECIAAAKAAAADGFICALAQGYDTIIEPSNSGFSGGERQRLSIARAILRDAPVLLLDEPTSALDASSEAAIRASLDALSLGRTTLIIAHRLSTILDADQIVVMDQGRVVDQGTHVELLDRDGIYAELFNLQFDLSPQGKRPKQPRSFQQGGNAQSALGRLASLFGYRAE